MKRILLILFLFSVTIGKTQNVIDWDGIYKLQLSDFQSTSTQIGGVELYSLQSSCGMDFSFYMSNAEFIFTKNFNSRVNCRFIRDASALVAPDSETATNILNFARYEFDLAELYARKFRRKLFEDKKVFSNVGFFKPSYEEIQKEYVIRHTNAGKETDVGRDTARLELLHAEVLKEIEQMPGFCKKYKPPKKSE